MLDYNHPTTVSGPRPRLTRPPLVEALVEVRWALQPTAAGDQLPQSAQAPPAFQTDPQYKLLVGRFFDRVQEKYPAHEQLPSAAMPDELLPFVAQHRFRVAADAWPLVQLGPGVLSVNDTRSREYTWEDFRERCLHAVAALFEAYPAGNDLKVTSLSLRYINGITFDYQHQNLLTYLRDSLKVSVALPDSLFEGQVANRPESLRLEVSFPASAPAGTVATRLATGRIEGKLGVIWELLVQSTGQQVPSMPREFGPWVDAAHVHIDDWFSRLIEGDLERTFTGG